jgi:hypothetical protein
MLRYCSMFVLALILAYAGAVRAADEDRSSPRFEVVAARTGLQVNVCNDISGEKFLCEKVFAEFCTYCRREDGNKCVTKKGVKRAEKGASTRASTMFIVFAAFCGFDCRARRYVSEFSHSLGANRGASRLRHSSQACSG